MKKIIVILPFIVLMIGGCQSTGRAYVDTALVETLEIEILPNTSKMFTYRLRWPEQNIPSHIQVDRGGGNPGKAYRRGGVDVGRTTHERLLENTDFVVKQSGYCREGFFELDRSISRYHLWIRGECKDDATATDRATFGDKAVLTPDRWRRG